MDNAAVKPSTVALHEIADGKVSAKKIKTKDSSKPEADKKGKE